MPYVDDVLVMELDFLTVDNSISVNNALFHIAATASFNSQLNLNQSSTLSLVRTGLEIPIVNINASFLNQTNTPISSGYMSIYIFIWYI